MMEKEHFDEEFKNRIKQIFEEYDDGKADEGWDLLREKYPEKKRRAGFFWWVSVAALFLIALIFGLFQADFFQQKTFKTVKQHKIDTVSTLANHHSSTQKTVVTQISADTSNTQKTPVKTASGFANRNLLEMNKIVQNQISADTSNTQKTPVKTASDFANKNSSETNKITQNQVSADTSKTEKIPVKTAPGFASIQKLQSKIANENLKNTAFINKKTDSAEIKNQQTFTTILKDSSAKKINPTLAKPAVKKYTETKIPTKKTKKSAAFSLEVYAGSHVNYATGSNNQLGLGAGFSTDFRLDKNFKLSTGLGLMQNNLTYKQNIPSTSLNAANSNYSATPTSTIGTGASIQNPSLNSLNTHLVALDIPVNLVYNFFAGKNSISISGGISSNTFVKEAYNYQYSNSTNTTQNIKSFNNFNFAKTLNLAAGFAYLLGKSKLQVEPFLKYPLGGSGSQQLQFGSVGINLKMKIQSLKK